MLIVSGVLSSTNVPQQIFTDNYLFSIGLFYGFKSISNGTGVNNSAGLNMGPSSVFMPNYVVPGDAFTYSVSPHHERASNFWAVGTAGDGIIAVLYP